MKSSVMEGLACTVGSREVIVPAGKVDRVAEFEIAPRPPLAHAWVGGLGLHVGRIVIAVALESRAEDDAQMRTARCVLMRPDDGFVWALEIAQARRFARREVRIMECAGGGGWLCPRDFLWEVSDAGGSGGRTQSVWLNVAAVREALLGTAHGSEAAE